jgi:hypothetical protein
MPRSRGCRVGFTAKTRRRLFVPEAYATWASRWRTMALMVSSEVGQKTRSNLSSQPEVRGAVLSSILAQGFV